MLLGDDGVGPYVAGMLEAGYEFDRGVTVVDWGTPGLDLVAHLSGVDAGFSWIRSPTARPPEP